MKRFNMKSLILLLLLILLINPFIKHAHAVTMVESCGILSIPGEIYYLKKDLTATLPGFCINVNADNITLDCKWFTITGNGEQPGIVLNTVSGVTVRNCTIQKFNTGLIDVNGNNNTIEKNTSRNNIYDGFVINANNNSVFQNIAHDNGNSGISIGGKNNDAYYNRAYSNTQSGIVLFGHGDNYVFKNLSQKNTLSGILINNSDNNQVIRNRVYYNKENGIYTLGNSNQNIIAGNNAESNAEYGFKDNTANNNIVDNDYLRNRCISNQIGGSNTSNLCTPQL